MRTLLFPLLGGLLLLAGCPSETTNDPPVDATILYFEESDEDNDTFEDPEQVDEAWTTRLVIHGEMRDCDYDNDAGANEWPYVGDVDNYEVVIPTRGYIDATVSWEMDADIDLLQILVEGNSISTGESATRDDRGPGEETFFIEDEFGDDDVLFIQVACAVGEDGDYELELLWEE